MAIDPSKFHLINVTDTCSVWNILSSNRLYSAAKLAGCDFCVTSFVQYECLIKRRNSPSTNEITLMDKLKAEQAKGAFKAHSSSIDDLQAIASLEKRKRLGKGELSAIAFAMKIRQGLLTDDRKAFQLAIEMGHIHSQTTPHLFSWLIFKNILGDGDKSTVLHEHLALGRQLGPHLQRAYEMALFCRLNSVPKTS